MNSLRAAFMTGVDRYNVHGDRATSMPHSYEGTRQGDKAYRAGVAAARRKRPYDRELQRFASKR